MLFGLLPKPHRNYIGHYHFAKSLRNGIAQAKADLLKNVFALMSIKASLTILSQSQGCYKKAQTG